QQASAGAAQAAVGDAPDADADAATDPFLLAQTGPSRSMEAAPHLRVASAYTSSPQSLNMPHIAFEMVRQIRGGASRFEIMMDPPEMGRIDVRLDIDSAGNLHARMAVERPETLDLLQRDARALERALAQAGLDTGRTNLEFSL